MGSKKKIAKQIVAIIKQNFGTDLTVYDLFGGGGAITAECLLNGIDVKYNEINRPLAEAFKKVIGGVDDDYLKSLLLSREEFYKIRDKTERTADDVLKLLINSFGNKGTSYLYAEDDSERKFRAGVSALEGGTKANP